MKFHFTTILIFSLVLLSVPINAQAAEPMELVSSGADQYSPGLDNERLAELLEKKDALMQRHRIVQLNETALNTDHRFIPSEEGEDFEWCIGELVKVTLFENETIILRNRYVDETGPINDYSDYWSWAGHVEGEESSAVGFVVADHRIISGFIKSSNYGNHKIERINDEYYLVYEQSRERFRNMDRKTMREISDDLRSESPPDDGSEELSAIIQSSHSGGPYTVKVNGFATASFDFGPVQALSDLTQGIILANIAVGLSGGTTTFQLSGNVYEVLTVDETNGTSSTKKMEHLLNNIEDDVHAGITALRDAAEADIMVGFGSRDQGGCGLVTKPPAIGNPLIGYATVAEDSSHCEDVENTVAHELGHVLGGGHVSTPGTYTNSHAWKKNSTKEKTIIAQTVECGLCNYLPRYSASSTPYGSATQNNIQVIEDLAEYVSGYRVNADPVPEPDLDPFGLQHTCTFATVTWDEPDEGATEYRVYLNGSQKYRGGDTTVKVGLLRDFWNDVEVEACIGDVCEDPMPQTFFFVPVPCTEE